jgi:hypothetical protein
VGCAGDHRPGSGDTKLEVQTLMILFDLSGGRVESFELEPVSLIGTLCETAALGMIGGYISPCITAVDAKRIGIDIYLDALGFFFRLMVCLDEFAFVFRMRSGIHILLCIFVSIVYHRTIIFKRVVHLNYP